MNFSNVKIFIANFLEFLECIVIMTYFKVFVLDCIINTNRQTYHYSSLYEENTLEIQ